MTAVTCLHNKQTNITLQQINLGKVESYNACLNLGLKAQKSN